MYTLAPDEKTAMVLVYTREQVIRGEAVMKQSTRPNIWLRTAGAPRYMHLLKPQVLMIGGSAHKTLSYSDLYIPVSDLLAYHPVVSTDPLDYDVDEKNRTNVPVTVLMGCFLVKGKARVSTQSDMGAILDLAKVPWMSIYDAEVTLPFLPQMPPIHSPLMLVSPEKVSFAVEV
jgi:hypothetical protein